MSDSGGADRASGHARFLSLNGTQIDVDHVDASKLAEPARRLGVSTDRLVAALQAALPAPPSAPPAPPSKDEIVSRLARNLHLSEDQVRAAITKVEGSRNFYFVVPLPASTDKQ